MKHTATPWIVTKNNHSDETKSVCIQKHELGASPLICDFVIDEDTAKFITRACNCHEELVEALSILLVDYENILYSEFGTENNKEPYRTPEWQKAQQALANATK